MMDNEKSRRAHQGVRVFGSAVIRVSPDIATIVVAVSRVEQKPEAAFAAAREGSRAVCNFLQHRGIEDFGTSRITLSDETQYIDGRYRRIGYVAKIGFRVVLHDMDQIEGTVSGLIGAGANELTSVSFQTSRLRELRAEARRRAIAAARDKAELYCGAAGVVAGGVLEIQDVNPESVRGGSESHVSHELDLDEPHEATAIDPEAIVVTAAVNVAYSIEQHS